MILSRKATKSKFLRFEFFIRRRGRRPMDFLNMDPLFESLYERIYPARVCVDNDASENCTVVKVDSANRHGILLEMVQVLSDLELIISKSYICSDGVWFMDVFHVTDKSGNKITDKSVVLYIQQALSATRKKSKETPTVRPGKDMTLSHVSTKGTALEITAFDKLGLLSEVCAVLADLGCHVTSAVAWTHNSRAACIIYVEEKNKSGAITNTAFLKNILLKMQNVVRAHHEIKEKWNVSLITPVAGEIHPERRLHQLMVGDMEGYMTCQGCGGSSGDMFDECINKSHGKSCSCTLVSIDTCKEKGYSVVNVTSRDRPKLLYDTVCALTDMDYDIFHAAMRSDLSMAFQEYYIRDRDGNILSSEEKKHRVVHCLIAAVERRESQGLQLDISAINRRGLLSDITRILRECGVSVLKAEVSLKDEKAMGTFYVRGASGERVNCLEIIQMLKSEADTDVQVATNSMDIIEERPGLMFSIGGLILSQIESLSRSLIPLNLVGYMWVIMVEVKRYRFW